MFRNKWLKRIGLGLVTLVLVVGGAAAFSAFEAHVINVTARIENALYVHPAELQYGTVFPQEHLNTSFFVAFSESFSARDQNRVGTVEYVIKQKPKPRDPADTEYCHNNSPQKPGNPNDPYYVKCYPFLGPYLSKTPDNLPLPGNDVGVPPFHDPSDPGSWAHGKLVKFPNINNDPGDTWTIDLAVPCFEGQCAQDWADFVHGLNPDADPDDYMLPPGLEHQVFGADLWVEVTKIY